MVERMFEGHRVGGSIPSRPTMKKLILLGTLFAFVLSSCVNYDPDTWQGSDVRENVKNIFGVEFNENQDWKTAFSGSVNINIDPLLEISKVQVMALIKDEEGSYLTILNELSLKEGETSIKLNYDAPKDNLGLYVAYITSSGNYHFGKITGNEVVSRSRRSMTRSPKLNDYNLPSGKFFIESSVESYANIRGWIPGEMLYQYSSQKMNAEEYDDEYKETLRLLVFSYFKNGRKYNNLPLVKQSGYYNEKIYPITTGDNPIIVSPIYKNDGGYQEVENSDLYYYYFKEENLGNDPVSYLEKLPKYKAIKLSECIKDDDIISKHASYALMYWGDDVPTVGTTQGSFQFPKGYKIGFMIQANTTAEGKKKQGELYGDGRLNNYINNYGNFKSSKLGVDGPRMAWLTINNKMLLCCESGTDTDFNDIIFEIEGGIEGLIVIPEVESNFYVFCYEDQRLGDYDMNDVVIKGRRLNDTKVEYTLMASGASDELYIYNVEGKRINHNKEVHSIFGKTRAEFINTSKHDNTPFVVDTITVNSNFSFLDVNIQPYVYDRTKNWEVRISQIGQDPHAIMIPYDFRWPLERICINKAYLKFNEWGVGSVTSTDWYKYPEEDKVY